MTDAHDPTDPTDPSDPADGPEPTDPPDRLPHLAATAADGIELTNPATATGQGARPRRRTLAPALALGVTLALVAGIVAITRDSGGGDPADVRTEPQVANGDGGNPQVAVLFGTGGGYGPADLTLRFLDGAGDEIATRRWSEVEETWPDIPDEVFSQRGLLQDVPAGDLTLEATLQLPGEDPQSCTRPFTMGEGDRLVLDLQRGPLGASFDRADGNRLVNDETHPPEITCAEAVPLADMIDGRTTPTGEEYLGLTLDEAQQRAADENLTIRVVAEDGMSLMVDAMLDPNRLDVMVWDGTVVAAELPQP